jgi:hypothetical protein
MKTFGIVLVLLGIAVLVFGGVGYDRQTTIMDLGGVKATATEHKTIPVAPITGAIALIGGLAVLIAPQIRRV